MSYGTNRFWHQPPPPHPRDAQIIKRATRLKIDLFRDKDGDLHGDFELSGGFGIYGEKEYDDPDEFKRQQAEAMTFVRELMREFEGGRDGEGLTTR